MEKKYAKGKNNRIFLPGVWLRIIEMDGAVSGMQGLEYIC